MMSKVFSFLEEIEYVFKKNCSVSKFVNYPKAKINTRNFKSEKISGKNVYRLIRKDFPEEKVLIEVDLDNEEVKFHKELIYYEDYVKLSYLHYLTERLLQSAHKKNLNFIRVTKDYITFSGKKTEDSMLIHSIQHKRLPPLIAALYAYKIAKENGVEKILSFSDFSSIEDDTIEVKGKKVTFHYGSGRSFDLDSVNTDTKPGYNRLILNAFIRDKDLFELMEKANVKILVTRIDKLQKTEVVPVEVSATTPVEKEEKVCFSYISNNFAINFYPDGKITVRLRDSKHSIDVTDILPEDRTVILERIRKFYPYLVDSIPDKLARFLAAIAKNYDYIKRLPEEIVDLYLTEGAAISLKLDLAKDNMDLGSYVAGLPYLIENEKLFDDVIFDEELFIRITSSLIASNLAKMI